MLRIFCILLEFMLPTVSVRHAFCKYDHGRLKVGFFAEYKGNKCFVMWRTKSSNISLLFFVCLGGIWELLHNSYVKGGLALGALLGPGRGRFN